MTTNTTNDGPVCVVCAKPARLDGGVCSPLCLTRAAHAVTRHPTITPSAAIRDDETPVGGKHAVRRVDAYPPWEDPAGHDRYVCRTCGYLTRDEARADTRHAASLAAITEHADDGESAA